MRRWLTAVGVAALMAGAPPARAADHMDSPAAKAAPESDITDVFAWMSADKSKVNLILNVSPAATSASKFSNQVQYVLHVSSQDVYGETDATKVKHINIICTFDTSQKISCWMGPASTTGVTSTTDFVSGDASAPAGLASENGKFTVFSGLRDDPFFFNLVGFQETEAAVETAGMAPGFAALVDASGCPHLDATTAGTLAAQLSHGKAGAAPADFFAKLNVLSMVFSVSTADLAPGGKIVGVWASTHRKP